MLQGERDEVVLTRGHSAPLEELLLGLLALVDTEVEEKWAPPTQPYEVRIVAALQEA